MANEEQRELACEYIERAWDSARDTDRSKWARKALKLDPDALDAYLLISQSLKINAERIAILREGVRRGKIIWAEAIKRPAQSYFWLDIESRPFMRLLHMLAVHLWDSVERDEAIKTAKFMLRLNANDNQGIRYLLLAWLPVTGAWAEFAKLLSKYRDDGGTGHLYAVCLDCFHTGQNAGNALRDALDANPFVPVFLADARKLPDADDSPLPGYVTMGSQDEAYQYAEACRPAWQSLPGAIDWLNREALGIVITG